MGCMGPGDPTPEKVEEVTQEVLKFLKEKYGYSLTPLSYFPNDGELREGRVEFLRQAVFGVIQLHYWFTW